MLKSLSLTNVGPADAMRFDFDPRLNVLTGDNGLGKTFILDIAWWALTGTWVGAAARQRDHYIREPRAPRGLGTPFSGTHRFLRLPRRPSTPPREPASIDWAVRWPDESCDIERDKFTAKEPWSPNIGQVFRGAIVLYVRVDGGISVWDPGPLDSEISGHGEALHFSDAEIWGGKPLDGAERTCEGMIRDWRDWAQDHDQSRFAVLKDVLKALSPDPSELIELEGEARRISMDDVRRIPFLHLGYGSVPITEVSAGMRRILSIAYLLAWCSFRHLETAAFVDHPPLRNMVLLVDEVESHLHPRWQRVIVPAILKAVERVQADMEVQVLMTTHSPMVLASLETLFEEDRDQLFNFRVDHGAVKVDRLDWEKHGDATGWLQSAVFGLGEARSKPAEEAIERANEFLRAEGGTPADAIVVQAALTKNIPGTDPFWATWNFGLRHKGIGGQP